MPQNLMELMRDESIETTMRDYVGRNAQGTATVLWDAYRGAIGNSSGNSSAESDNAANQISNSTPENKSPSENRPV